MPSGAETGRIEQESAQLRRELGLGDLVLQQVLFVVGLSWVGVAAKLGQQQLPFWALAFALFYLPQAMVVIHLSRRFPLEGGLYQWAKLGFGRGTAFLVGWNLWLFAIVLLGASGLSLANAIIYAIGPSAEFLSGNKVYVGVTTGLLIGSLMVVSVLGLRIGKWVHNAGGVLLMSAFTLLLVVPFVGTPHGSARDYHPFDVAAPALTLLSVNIFSKIAVGGLSGFEYVAVLAGETRDAKRNIGRSVMIASPVIALLFVLGTAAMQAIVPIDQVDLVGPVPQALRFGLGESGAVAILIPFAITAVTSRMVANSSVLFASTSRMPMVAGWDNLMPAWFSVLHARYRTPVNSIVFIGGCALVFGLLGITNVGEQEAFQLLDNAAGVFYALTYLVLFAIPIWGAGRQSGDGSGWLKAASYVGLVVTLLYVGFAVVPIVSVVSRAAFALKMGGLVVGANAIGVALYLRRRR